MERRCSKKKIKDRQNYFVYTTRPRYIIQRTETASLPKAQTSHHRRYGGLLLIQGLIRSNVVIINSIKYYIFKIHVLTIM